VDCCCCCCCCRCGSYARALQYFETYVRDKHGGGLNPSAFNGGCSSYNYDDVSSKVPNAFARYSCAKPCVHLHHKHCVVVRIAAAGSNFSRAGLCMLLMHLQVVISQLLLLLLYCCCCCCRAAGVIPAGGVWPAGGA
jgi:hypothetical protein